MNNAFYIGAVGLHAQQRALEIVSGNIANVNTPAFKRSDVRFASMLATRTDPDAPPASLDQMLSTAGVATTAALALDETGTIESTGRPTDLAIRGKGFIELMGPDGQTLLWRGGPLKIGEDGALTAADSGLPLRTGVTMPADATDMTISADGALRAKSATGEDIDLGQLTLVTPRDGTSLEALDGGLFRAADDASLDELKPGEDGAGTIVQGSVERSNVEMTTEMVQLMLIQRSYSANAQVVQAADQLMGIANGLRR